MSTRPKDKDLQELNRINNELHVIGRLKDQRVEDEMIDSGSEVIEVDSEVKRKRPYRRVPNGGIRKVGSDYGLKMQRIQYEARRKFVEFGYSIEQLALDYGVAESTIRRWRYLGGWTILRQRFMREHPLDEEFLFRMKSHERSVGWEILRIKILEMIKSLDVTNKNFPKVARELAATYEKAIRGERLEDGQPISVVKENVSTFDDEDNDAINIVLTDKVAK